MLAVEMLDFHLDKFIKFLTCTWLHSSTMLSLVPLSFFFACFHDTCYLGSVSHMPNYFPVITENRWGCNNYYFAWPESIASSFQKQFCFFFVFPTHFGPKGRCLFQAGLIMVTCCLTTVTQDRPTRIFLWIFFNWTGERSSLALSVIKWIQSV